MMLKFLSVTAFTVALIAAPKVTSLKGNVTQTSDSTFTLKTQVVARNMIAGDSVRFRYYADTTLLSARRRVGLVDSLVNVKAPAYGQTITYKGCAQIIRGGVFYPTTQKCWGYSYTRPAAPEPVIDSVIQLVVRPGSDSMLAGATRQFCAFAVLKSGRRVKTNNSINIPACETEYQKWLAEVAA